MIPTDRASPIGYGLAGWPAGSCARFVGCTRVFVMKAAVLRAVRHAPSTCCCRLHRPASPWPRGLSRRGGLHHRPWLIRSGAATPELGCARGHAVRCLLGLVVGWFTIRRQGIYATMITLAMAQMVCLPAGALSTGARPPVGALGTLFGPGPLGTTSPATTWWWRFGRWLPGHLPHGPLPFGQVLAIRENEPRAVSLGYDVDNPLLSLHPPGWSTISLKTLVLGFATLSDRALGRSGEVVLT